MGRKASSLRRLRHGLEALQAARDVVPGRLLADEDRDLGPEARRLVERAGVEIDHPGHHLCSAVDHALAGRTGIAAGGFAAATGARAGTRLTLQRHGTCRKAQPTDMARAAGALAGTAMAEALHHR